MNDNLFNSSVATNNWADYTYLKLVEDVLENGILKPTRAKINGKNISAYSVFGRQVRFHLADGLPILTTKKINFNAIVHELIWFLRGESNIKYLKDNNVHIWDAWADKNGELGYGTYGSLWKKFPFFVESEEYEKKDYITDLLLEDKWGNSYIEGKLDQIHQLIQNIELVKKDPTASCGRRLIVTAWHPYYTDKVGLPPCHCLYQFNVTGDKLSCHLYQRSCDLFLGVPFNFTSYSILTHIIAHLTGLTAHEFVHTYTDLHIYENHVDQLREQITRTPYTLPKLLISNELTNIDDLKRENISLDGYKSWPSLRGEVAI